MARTVRTKIYKFDELSKQAQDKAIESLYDINVDENWWKSTYDDAEEIGLKITGFDIEQYCNGKFIASAESCADNIIKEHGEHCETYKTAAQFIADRKALVEKYSDGINKGSVTEENNFDFDSECDDLEAEFLKSICEDYRIILSKDYDFLTGYKAIKETIIANEYEFKKDGTKY